MTLLSLILAVLKFASALTSMIDRKSVEKGGYDKAIKQVLAEIARRTSTAREIENEIDSLTDDAVIDRLSKYSQRVLPDKQTDNVPTDGTPSTKAGS